MRGRLTFELKKLRFRGVVAQLSLTSYGEEEPEFEPATLCSPYILWPSPAWSLLSLSSPGNRGPASLSTKCHMCRVTRHTTGKLGTS